MKLIVIIGHRGVGKTTLLERWKVYEPSFEFFDLDCEIEKQWGAKVSKIFEEKGETSFREMELVTFDKLKGLSQKTRVIACGAGFPAEKIPTDAFVLWLRRDSDLQGRVFLNRPRLNPDQRSLEEFEIRRKQREPKFLARANLIYTMPEGLVGPDLEEKQILLGSYELKASITLLRGSKEIHGPSVQIELRNDLLSEKELDQVFHNGPILYAVRVNQEVPQKVISSYWGLDWDLSRPIPTGFQPTLLSTHENDFSVALKQLKEFENTQFHLKFCPQVETWSDLWDGYQWQQQDAEKRNFLPRSQDGRWSWFRLYMKGQQQLNFVREGTGSNLDQPTVWEWLSIPSSPVINFGAVLGDPVGHSYSPAFHKEFFKIKKCPFFKIKVRDGEWREALDVLFKLGLRYAAVTSPLKLYAGTLAQQPEPLNTIMWDSSQRRWLGLNTDTPALSEVLAPYRSTKVMVWGGGGVLPGILKTLPMAAAYSARLGRPKEGHVELQNPEVFIWAAGTADLNLIPKNIKPRIVIDMSYTENSPGRELADLWRSEYISGIEFFFKQAKLQQKFWK